MITTKHNITHASIKCRYSRDLSHDVPDVKVVVPLERLEITLTIIIPNKMCTESSQGVHSHFPVTVHELRSDIGQRIETCHGFDEILVGLEVGAIHSGELLVFHLVPHISTNRLLPAPMTLVFRKLVSVQTTGTEAGHRRLSNPT